MSSLPSASDIQPDYLKKVIVLRILVGTWHRLAVGATQGSDRRFWKPILHPMVYQLLSDLRRTAP